jgi:SAM-dependent methyltransferase
MDQRAAGPQPRHRTYDVIGRGYATKRRPDPRIQAAINEALGDAKTVLNAGAGTGSYEPIDRAVVAIDPSVEMLAQRPRNQRRAARAVAENLPFRRNAFGAAMAVLTVHHWGDRQAGYAELRRVARRRVVLTYEPAIHNDLWIVRDYVPEIGELDRSRPGFSVAEVAEGIGASEIVTVPIPWDCTDGFITAYWRRPEAFLDPRVRQSTSGFSLVDQDAVTRGVHRLQADLASGAWEERYGDLAQIDELDTGIRLVVAQG